MADRLVQAAYSQIRASDQLRFDVRYAPDSGATADIAVVRSKNDSPTWNNVRVALRHFNRAGLLGLVQDLYTANKDNQAFLHARLGLGHDQLQPFKVSISNWICPDVTKNRPISVSKAKKTIADYKKAIGDYALQFN